ncbi:phosphodiester glycosidase family protein [uncultured Roseobacter sp.]|uniref:phosphodiester glycosidase family protein n=1 Tax=uncultured Roseobacter sp. TaxID=114847 RepID=UPI002621043C|nr:phosphodiester glycosidase family protein [uncultured Roseobacter sp.]
MIRAALTVLAAALIAERAQAVECGPITFDDARYTICEVTPATETLELFLYDDTGAPMGQFSTINRALDAEGRALVFAMNAGMYHDNRAPVGHYVEDGQEIMRVIESAGPGNFGLLPNGVFCVREGRADVFETGAFVAADPACDHATQSGPMLVIDGALHPRFLPDGTSKFIRNGVGTSADGQRVVFAISDDPVNFHSFGRLFRDHLGLSNALYFDGKVSRLYAPSLGRSDFGFSLGPIIGVTGPLE